MSRVASITTALLLTFVTLLSILSVVGGGITIPPFKSTSWLRTSTSYIGLYGGCLTDGVNPNFFSSDGPINVLQSRCKTLFNSTAPSATDPIGLLSRKDSIVLSGLHVAAFLVILLTWTFKSLRSKTLTTSLSIFAFFVQAIGFGLSTWKFYVIQGELLTGKFVQGTEGVDETTILDTHVTLGPGLYMSGAVVVGLLGVSLGSAYSKRETHEPLKTDSRWDP